LIAIAAMRLGEPFGEIVPDQWACSRGVRHLSGVE
jgi:hypothetical protein